MVCSSTWRRWKVSGVVSSLISSGLGSHGSQGRVVKKFRDFISKFGSGYAFC
jgi:hypothetical protein